MARKRYTRKTPAELAADKERRVANAKRLLGVTAEEQNGQATPAKGPPRYLFAHEVTATELTWLWPGFVPRGLPSLVYGPSLSGKSTIMTALAAAVTAGRAPTGRGLLPPSNVVWLAGEEPIEAVVVPRLKAAGADLSRVIFPQLWSDGLRRGWRLLEQGTDFVAVVKGHQAALVIIDPIACFLGGELPSESNAAARATFGFLTTLGQETGATCLSCKHPRKSGRGGSTEQMSGGLEWFNTPRSVLLVGPHPSKDGVRVCIQQKPSLCEAAVGVEFQIEQKDGRGVALFTRDSDVAAKDVLGEELGAVERSMLDEAKDFLRHHLEGPEKKTTDLQKYAQESGLAWMTVRRAKGELGVSHAWRTEEGRKFVVWQAPQKGF